MAAAHDCNHNMEVALPATVSLETSQFLLMKPALVPHPLTLDPTKATMNSASGCSGCCMMSRLDPTKATMNTCYTVSPWLYPSLHQCRVNTLNHHCANGPLLVVVPMTFRECLKVNCCHVQPWLPWLLSVRLVWGRLSSGFR